MLLNKKYYSFAVVFFALSPLVITTLESRADDTTPAAAAAATPVATAPATAAPATAAPATATPAAATPAPVAAPYDPSETWHRSGKPNQVIDTDLSKYIQGFKVKKITDSEGNTHLAVYGLGLKSCLRHFNVDLDAPKDNDTGVYAFKFTKNDVTSSSGRSSAVDADCNPEKTRQCSRDPDSDCVSIKEGLSGVNGVENTTLDQDGKVAILVENTKDTDPSTAIQFRDLSKTMGGPINFKSAATLGAELDKRRAQEHGELLVATCKGAEKGNRDDLENLREILGTDGVNDKEKLLTKLQKKVDEKELAELEKKLDSAESIDALNTLIDEANDFARDPLHPDSKPSIVKFLVDGIAKKALDLDSDGKDIKNLNMQKEKLVARALNVAHKLDPKNASLRAAYEKARHLVSKETTTTDNMWNDSTRAQAVNGFNSVLNWAASSKSPEARSALADYINDMPANIKPYATQVARGNLQSSDRDWLANVYGQSLDQTAAVHSMTEEFNAYRQNAVSNPMYGGQNPSYNAYGATPGMSGNGMNGRF